MSSPSWTPLHTDYITHYGSCITDFRRATVCIIGNSTYQLSKWYKGCGFNPSTVNYKSMEEAKHAGEDWYHRGV